LNFKILIVALVGIFAVMLLGSPSFVSASHFEKLFSEDNSEFPMINDGRKKIKLLTFMEKVAQNAPECRNKSGYNSPNCEDKSRYQLVVYEYWTGGKLLEGGQLSGYGSPLHCVCGIGPGCDKITQTYYEELEESRYDESRTLIVNSMQNTQTSTYVKDKGSSQQFHAGLTVVGKIGASAETETGDTKISAEKSVTATAEVGYDWEEHEQETWTEESTSEEYYREEFENQITQGKVVTQGMQSEIEYGTPVYKDRNIWWDRPQKHVELKYDLWEPILFNPLNPDQLDTTVKEGAHEFSGVKLGDKTDYYVGHDLPGNQFYAHTTAIQHLPLEFTKGHFESIHWPPCGGDVTGDYIPKFDQHDEKVTKLVAFYRPSDSNAQVIVAEAEVDPTTEKTVYFAVEGATVTMQVPSFNVAKGESACPTSESSGKSDEYGSVFFYLVPQGDKTSDKDPTNIDLYLKPDLLITGDGVEASPPGGRFGDTRANER